MQLFMATRIKEDLTDDTIGMSPFAISAPNADFDGDALYMVAIKEMASVFDYLKIHPMSTLLGGEGDGLSNTVHMSDEMSVACHAYFTGDGELDIDKYYRAIHG